MPISLARLVRSRFVSVVVLGLAVAGCQSSPAAQAPATSAASTEILWDRYGVPHIFAPDHPSLFHAYGYAQMEAHSELLHPALRAGARSRRRVLRRSRTSTPTAGSAPTACPSTAAASGRRGRAPEFAPAHRRIRGAA